MRFQPTTVLAAALLVALAASPALANNGNPGSPTELDFCDFSGV